MARRRRPGEQWERYGAEDPYFGVLSAEEFSGRLDEESRGRFFASGEQRVETVLRDIRKTLDADFAPRTALDFGCGVGRLAVPLAQVCNEVIGVDISPSMLAEADRNAKAAGLSNARFILTAEMASLPAKVDLVHSMIVLQHIPTAEGMRHIATMLSLLSVGGIAALHVSIRAPTARARAYWWTMRNVPLAHNVWNISQRRAWAYPQMQMNRYDLGEILILGHQYSCGPMLTKIHPAQSPSDWHGATVLLRRYA